MLVKTGLTPPGSRPESPLPEPIKQPVAVQQEPVQAVAPTTESSYEIVEVNDQQPSLPLDEAMASKAGGVLQRTSERARSLSPVQEKVAITLTRSYSDPGAKSTHPQSNSPSKSPSPKDNDGNISEFENLSASSDLGVRSLPQSRSQSPSINHSPEQPSSPKPKQTPPSPSQHSDSHSQHSGETSSSDLEVQTGDSWLDVPVASRGSPPKLSLSPEDHFVGGEGKNFSSDVQSPPQSRSSSKSRSTSSEMSKKLAELEAKMERKEREAAEEKQALLRRLDEKDRDQESINALVAKHEAAINEKGREAEELKRQFDEQNQEMKGLLAKIDEKNRESAEFKRQFDEQNQETKNLLAKIDEKGREAAEFKRQFDEQNQETKNLLAKIDEKDREAQRRFDEKAREHQESIKDLIAKHEATIEKKAHEAAELKRQLNEKDKRIETLESELSKKATTVEPKVPTQSHQTPSLPQAQPLVVEPPIFVQPQIPPQTQQQPEPQISTQPHHTPQQVQPWSPEAHKPDRAHEKALHRLAESQKYSAKVNQDWDNVSKTVRKTPVLSLTSPLIDKLAAGVKNHRAWREHLHQQKVDATH